MNGVVEVEGVNSESTMGEEEDKTKDGDILYLKILNVFFVCFSHISSFSSSNLLFSDITSLIYEYEFDVLK